jgi:hypothetical protein
MRCTTPKRSFPLRWPVEDQYVQLQFNVLTRLLRNRGHTSTRFIAFWPDERRFSLVITHAVDTQEGHDFIGTFVELPYTLVQDHTLTIALGRTTHEAWLAKVEFVARHTGMALRCAHPDYLRDMRRGSVYKRFLATMRERDDFWHALPRDVAAWWRHRAGLDPHALVLPARTPAGGTISLAEFEPPCDIRPLRS